MYLSRIGMICLALVFVAVVGYGMGQMMAYRTRRKEEGFGRVLPESMRHPDPDPIQVIPSRAAGTLSGLNEWVDQRMETYFDQQGFPFNETRMLCLSTVQVPFSNSLVDPWTLSKLNDIGLYVIRNVIPKCATTSVAEQEAIVWPPMVWSTSLNLMHAGNHLSSVGSLYGRRQDGSNSNGSSSDGSSTDGSNNSSPASAPDKSKNNGNGGSGGGGGGGGATSCSVNGPCGQPCPTSCIDAALMTKSPAPNPPATNPNQKGALTQNLDAGELAKWWSLFTEDQGGTANASPSSSSTSSSSSSSSSVRNIMQDYIPVESPTDSKLDTYLKTEIIDAYFDPITGIPTPKFIDKFKQYTQGQIPMDEAHQNKLIDMVFYVMETVVTGLPTMTKPSFDFIWRPIPRLSQR